ncbi:DUF1294 domain-containing protein [Shimia ponticola]|uniref:DUF1294 domain-containing protein n=1 Tax=Shimia ponticola TaxID=2582893 RepID=UPI0011BE0A50|nr:DUF1294 domain-containing protein [Shimia ponticola]
MDQFAHIPPAILVLAFVLAANCVTVFLFWYDKRQAMSGHRRVPERRLLFWSALGGTPGAFWARARFRHKTRKQPFSTLLWAILILQCAALCLVTAAPFLVADAALSLSRHL